MCCRKLLRGGVLHRKSVLMMVAGSLLPGSLVNARIRDVLADGLLVSFLTYFNGSIDRFHLSHVSPACISMTSPSCTMGGGATLAH